ncbi:MAG TPA: NAD(P)/FAD-dependent oxidoreductase [Vitreimonas sp.]|nr:NAD(P)/FAD-dependent oxidoreductase [Vitreimonas sp.]
MNDAAAPEYDCAIIGGGFTGLAAAVRLLKLGRSVIVIEKENQLGGLASGFDVGGYEIERFYHHWFTNDTHVPALAAEIGAGDKIVTRKTATGMYYAGSFFRLSTPMDLLKFSAIPFFDRVRTGIATLWVRTIKDWLPLEGKTGKEWLIQLFGKNSYRVIWEPLLIGKFGAHADTISAVWFWNKLTLRGGSRSKDGGEALAYYRGGFGEFARNVGDFIRAQGGAIRVGVAATNVRRSDDGRIHIETSKGEVIARSALVTTPMPLAAEILDTPAEYKDRLRAIKYIGNVCLVLELDRSLSDQYWTNVNDPSFPFVGVIEHTNFEPAGSYGGRHIVYLSKYLPTEEPLYNMNAGEALAFATPHIQRMFPSFDTTWVKHAYVWREPYAQPLVVKHYSKLIPPFETPIANVFIATMAQVYPEDRGTNYAIREGHKAAEAIHARLGEAVTAG